MQHGAAVAAQLGGLAWLAGGWSVLGRCRKWVDRHTTVAERAAIWQLAEEAWAYAESEWVHLPSFARAEHAVRYLQRVSQAQGMRISLQEAQAAVTHSAVAHKAATPGSP